MTAADSTGADEARRRTDAQWRAQLPADAYAVLRQAATERPFTGAYVDSFEPGTYVCRGCGNPVFDAPTKFASSCGWPSFYAPRATDAVTLHRDTTLGMERVEVRCARCDSHLGHVFAGEGYPTPTDQRYCINSVALQHEPPRTEPDA